MGGEDGCEGRFESTIVTNIGQGHLTFGQENVKEKAGNFRNLWLW